MAAQTNSETDQHRNELTNKVELEVDRKVNLSTKLIQYHRIILQDLPFNGNPELLTDTHRQAVVQLIEKSQRYLIYITKIIGYASKIGEPEHNLDLSQRRAQAVFDYLAQASDSSGLFSDNSFYATVSIEAKGESNLPYPSNATEDNPLNRRVEIVYRLEYIYPTPIGGTQPASKFWKVDFGVASSGSISIGLADIGASHGAGKLTMLPDADTGQSQTIDRNMRFDQLGLSIGLMSKLKKLKFIQKLPGVKRLLSMLDTGSAANYPKTTALLNHIGFSVDIISVGGEFLTSEPLTFEDMQSFNFAVISGSLSVLGKGEGALLLLHSGHFFASTIVFGLGQNIAAPDIEVQFVPAGVVTLN